MSKYRAAVVGCGPRSHGHLSAYRLLDTVEVVACCDRLDDRRMSFETKYGLRGYRDPVEMIEREKPDLVHLVTRPGTRVEQLQMVSELGVPACIVEKPISLEVRDWRALCALAESTETKVSVGAQWRYSPHMSRCREALASGRLGRPLLLEATAVSSLCDQGVHVLDWAMSLNGESPARRASGAVHGADELGSTQPGPRGAAAYLAFENGVGCSFVLGPAAPLVSTSYEAIGRYSHCRVAAYCERGRVLFEEFGRWEIASPEGLESGETMSMAEWEAHNDQAQANLTQATISWLEDDARPADTCLTRTLAQWNAILGVYASGVWSRPVDLPFDPPEDLFAQLTAHLTRDHEQTSSPTP